jgi:hypothetical protein
VDPSIKHWQELLYSYVSGPPPSTLVRLTFYHLIPAKAQSFVAMAKKLRILECWLSTIEAIVKRTWIRWKSDWFCCSKSSDWWCRITHNIVLILCLMVLFLKIIYQLKPNRRWKPVRLLYKTKTTILWKYYLKTYILDLVKRWSLASISCVFQCCLHLVWCVENFRYEVRPANW